MDSRNQTNGTVPLLSKRLEAGGRGKHVKSWFRDGETRARRKVNTPKEASKLYQRAKNEVMFCFILKK